MTGFRAIAALVGVIAVSAPAAGFAATFNFADMANTYMANNNYEGTWQQVTGGALAGSGGVNITSATATYTDPTTGNVSSADPFFDSKAGMNNKDAGLGVCHLGSTYYSGTGDISNCASRTSAYSSNSSVNTADDNLSRFESLTLGFNQKVTLTDLLIRDDNHDPIISATSAIMINGHSYGTDSNGYVVNLAGLGPALSFDFSTASGCESPGIYLSTLTVAAVPLPAGIVLLPTALFLTGFAGRKRRRKTAAA